MSDRRNPYLILGIDYGSSPEVAARAFAKTTRRLRREPNAPYTIEDATWALHQIEQAVEDPSAAITTYRVPADLSVFQPLTQGPAGLSQPRSLARMTAPSQEAVDDLRSAALTPTLRADLETLASLGLNLCFFDPDSAPASQQTRS